ncbi:MAG TPA: hypothetical protein H9728_04965 [Candidatus Borkfalkia excrementavium]|uniref:SHS2 domain-containing protein n=1 Tax=Candidatus Borkfalkia excrementavium TaxID=2838505 RepID=A0A9D2CGJ3_9FIRM|nr:hypothetical protein [Candidatus Borkfalkia excrementavium]
MNRKSVAVLDVESSDVTALIGERGVNNTFVFKGRQTENYDGFADAEFFSPEGLRRAVFNALEHVESSCGDKISEIYVGVPGEFIKVVTKRNLISFQRKRKVNSYDIRALYENGFTAPEDGYSLIRRSAIFYSLSDKRRTIDPVGMISDSLEGYLSYFLASDRFTEILTNILTEYGIRKINFLPTSLAESLYLIPSEVRDEYALLLDIGYMSMTFSVVCGNGIAYQSACSVGGGHIPACMIQDIDIPFHVAEAILKKVNLSSIDGADSRIEYLDKTETYTVSLSEVKEKVKEGLDLICEVINKCLELCGDRSIDYKPILLTGGGITHIRGAREHISNRLNKVVEILTPNLPYYNKAAQSSLLSLLDMALSDRREKSFIYKILYGFGG